MADSALVLKELQHAFYSSSIADRNSYYGATDECMPEKDEMNPTWVAGGMVVGVLEKVLFLLLYQPAESIGLPTPVRCYEWLSG